MKILLIVSSRELRQDLEKCLLQQNVLVDQAVDADSGWHQLQTFAYETVVMEVGGTGHEAFTLCRRLREIGCSLPILLLVPDDLPQGLERGLESGADSCLVSPCTERLFLAQVQSLARSAGARRAYSKLSWGGLSLDPVGRRVAFSGREISVHRKEYQILELLLSHPRKVFSQQELGERLWAVDEEIPNAATVRSHIRSIRRKLEKAGAHNLLQTHYGHGYHLNPSFCPLTETANDEPSKTDSLRANLWQELMLANARLREEIELRVRVEAELVRSEAMSTAAQRVAQIGCWEYDLVSQTVFWTEELYLIHGLVPGTSPPTPEQVLEMVHPDDREIHEREIKVPALKGLAWESNLRIVRADNGQVRHINARGGPVHNSDGVMTSLIGTTFDVTRWLQERPLAVIPTR